MIITIGGQKGGIGKSTIACELVAYLERKKKSVVFIDADKQASSTDWVSYRYEMTDVKFKAVQLQGKMVVHEARKFAAEVDYVVIDAGGSDNVSQRAALSVSDAVLTLFNPSSLSIWTLETVEEVMEEALALNHDLKCFSALNRAWPAGKDNKQSALILKKSEVFTFIPKFVGNRKAFSDCMGSGLSVAEMKYPDKKAVEEINALFGSLLRRI